MSKNTQVKVESKPVYKPIMDSNTVEIDGVIKYLDIMVYDGITQEEIEKHIVG